VKKRALNSEVGNSQVELLKDMFIAFLILQGVPQTKVAKVVQVATVRVNKIGKNLKVKGP
jgi:hypothetical protein